MRGGALKAVNLGIGQTIPFLRRCRFQVLALRPGYIKAKIPLKGNKNHFGAMYAGALFTVAEAPGGVLALMDFNDGFFPVLKDLKIDFIKITKSDVTVCFEMSEEERSHILTDTVKNTKSDFQLVGSIVDKDGVVVATTVASYQLRSKKG